MVEQEEVLMVTVMEGHVDPIVNLKVHVLAKASPMQWHWGQKFYLFYYHNIIYHFYHNVSRNLMNMFGYFRGALGQGYNKL